MKLCIENWQQEGEDSVHKLPIRLDLKMLNNKSNIDIGSVLRNEVTKYYIDNVVSQNAVSSYVDKALKDGQAIVFLDGLDEIAKGTKDLIIENFKETTRKYWALVWGVIKHDTGTIDAPIGRDSVDRKKMCVTATNSKPAITHFKVLERYKNATLIELNLETGRTHQIRVHMNYIGYPVVNDPVYGKRKIIDETGQCLHAKTLGFIHPTTKKYMEFNSELPECFVNIMNQLKSE